LPTKHNFDFDSDTAFFSKQVQSMPSLSAIKKKAKV